MTSGKFLEALGSGIGTGSIFCLSFSLSNRVICAVGILRYINHISIRGREDNLIEFIVSTWFENVPPGLEYKELIVKF